MTLVTGRTTVAVGVSPWSITGRATIAVGVSGPLVTGRLPVSVGVSGPTITGRLPVRVSIAAQVLTGRLPVQLGVYGEFVTGRSMLSTSVNPFAGTGVHRARHRDRDDPVRSLVPPTPPAPVTATRRLGNAYWTTPLPADAPLAPTSSDFVARLAYQATMTQTTSPIHGFYGAPYNTRTEGSMGPGTNAGYALPIYVMPTDTPRVRVYTARQGPTLQPVLDLGVPLPDPALIPGGTIAPSGTDGSVIIICGNEVWELWQLKPTTAADIAAVAAGYSWQCSQGGKMTDKNTHPGIWAGGGGGGRVAGWFWGVAASGLSKLATILTAEDYFNDTINHPLELVAPITGGNQLTSPHDPDSVLPATRYDRMTFVPGGQDQASIEALRVPEGSRFRLPATFDVDAWIATLPVRTPGPLGADQTRLRKVLVCLRDFGCVLDDSAGVVGFGAEHPKTFGTPYNPFTAAQTPVWGNFGQQLPWSSLVQVAAPATDISVPGTV